MRCGQCEKKEEWLCSVFLHKRTRLLEKEIARIRQTFRRVAGPGHITDRRNIVGQLHDGVVPPQKIRVVVVRVRLVNKSEKRVEALLPRRTDAVGFTEAPFADEAGRIAAVAQHARHRHFVGAQGLRRVTNLAGVAPHGRVARVFARHQHAPRRRAHRATRVKLRETHPFRREAVEIRRANLRLAVGPQFPVTEVVGEDENDVGLAPQRLRRVGHGSAEETGERSRKTEEACAVRGESAGRHREERTELADEFKPPCEWIEAGRGFSPSFSRCDWAQGVNEREVRGTRSTWQGVSTVRERGACPLASEPMGGRPRPLPATPFLPRPPAPSLNSAARFVKTPSRLRCSRARLAR